MLPEKNSFVKTTTLRLMRKVTALFLLLVFVLSLSSVNAQAAENPLTANRVQTPVILPDRHVHEAHASVSITCGTSDASIYFSTDGSSPDRGSRLYTGPFTLSESCRITAIAVKAGMKDSLICESQQVIYTTGGAQVITVTNSSDNVNGDTAGFTALRTNNGGDGISLREAVRAANNTTGKKRIVFDKSLAGTTIKLRCDIWPPDILVLTSGDLTIDGDIDDNGQPDITLDGSLKGNGGQVYDGLIIWSSGNMIKGLNMKDFLDVAIGIGCPDAGTTIRTISNNIIAENYVESRDGRLAFGTGGLINWSENPKMSDIQFTDLCIISNTVRSSTNSGISMWSGTGGASRNKFISVNICNNKIKASGTGIDVNAGDTNSAWHEGGSKAPVYYSDNNEVHNLSISNNEFDGCYLSLLSANMGNRDSKIDNIHIFNNNIKYPGNFGIVLHTANDCGLNRSTDGNSISGVDITQNTISGAKWSVNISSAEKQNKIPNIGYADNTLQNLVFKDNTILDYENAGLRIWGGMSLASGEKVHNNAIKDVDIASNYFSSTCPEPAIELIGGWSDDGTATGNSISGVRIINNAIDGSSSGIQIIGGRGLGAANNSVSVRSYMGNLLNRAQYEPVFSSDEDAAQENAVSVPSPVPDGTYISSWARQAVQFWWMEELSDNPLFASYSANITRAEFAMLAIKTYERKTGHSAAEAAKDTFSDIAGNPYESSILKASKMKIINGNGSGMFLPDAPITRQEISVMLCNLIQAVYPSLAIAAASGTAFKDADSIAPWARTQVQFLNQNNILTGTGDMKISPLNNSSREQGFVLVFRCAEWMGAIG